MQDQVNQPRITIHPATDPDNPRDYGRYTVMVCHHQRYELPNECENPIMPRDFNSWEEMGEYLVKVHGAAVILPVYMYDHSGTILSTKPFSCKWDSGQVGWIYATRGNILEVRGIKCLTAKAKKLTIRDMANEVDTYSKYMNNEVYDVHIEIPGVADDEWTCGHYDPMNAKDYLEPQYHPLLERAVREYRGS